MGRPTEYTQKIADELCSRIALGNSLSRITRADDMPCASTVYNWFGKYPKLVDNYARAKQDSADSRADQIEEIAEKVLEGEYEPAAARVAIDAFKWTSGKHKPKKYGDKVQQELTGPNGGPVETNSKIEWVIQPVTTLDNATDEEDAKGKR